MKIEKAKKKIQKYFDLIKREVPELKLYRGIYQCSVGTYECSGVITEYFLDYYDYGGNDLFRYIKSDDGNNEIHLEGMYHKLDGLSGDIKNIIKAFRTLYELENEGSESWGAYVRIDYDRTKDEFVVIEGYEQDEDEEWEDNDDPDEETYLTEYQYYSSIEQPKLAKFIYDNGLSNSVTKVVVKNRYSSPEVFEVPEDLKKLLQDNELAHTYSECIESLISKHRTDSRWTFMISVNNDHEFKIDRYHE